MCVRETHETSLCLRSHACMHHVPGVRTRSEGRERGRDTAVLTVCTLLLYIARCKHHSGRQLAGAGGDWHEVRAAVVVECEIHHQQQHLTIANTTTTTTNFYSNNRTSHFAENFCHSKQARLGWTSYRKFPTRQFSMFSNIITSHDLLAGARHQNPG